MKLKACPRISLFSCILLIAILLAITSYRWSGEYRLNKHIQNLQAQGYPITQQNLAQTYSLPQGTKNAADYYQQAFDIIESWDLDTMDALDALPIIGRVKLPPHSQALPNPMVALIEQHLQENQVLLEILHQGAQIPDCHYPVDFNTLLVFQDIPKSKSVRYCNDTLLLNALVHLENKDLDLFIHDVRTSLALKNSIQTITMLDLFTQYEFINDLVPILERAFNQTTFSMSQLKELTTHLQPENLNQIQQQVIINDRCIAIETLKSLFPQAFPNAPKITKDQPRKMIFFWNLLHHTGHAQHNIIDHLEYMQDILEIINLPESKQLIHINSIDTGHYEGFLNQFVTSPSLNSIIKSTIHQKAKQRILSLALRIEQYRSENNQVPQNLDQLIPSYIETIPNDPFDGQPIRYKQTEAGYTIYSIGTDLKDDGGKKRPSKEQSRQDDITFTIQRN